MHHVNVSGKLRGRNRPCHGTESSFEFEKRGNLYQREINREIHSFRIHRRWISPVLQKLLVRIQNEARTIWKDSAAPLPTSGPPCELQDPARSHGDCVDDDVIRCDSFR
jgi:hypothetical protein